LPEGLSLPMNLWQNVNLSKLIQEEFKTLVDELINVYSGVPCKAPMKIF
jgi:hypothetical protein